MASHKLQEQGVLKNYKIPHSRFTCFFNSLRVTVHSTKTLPLVDEQGLDAETNQATNIAFHSVNYERQKHPYGICISSWNETDLGSMVTSEHGELPYAQGVVF